MNKSPSLDNSNKNSCQSAEALLSLAVALFGVPLGMIILRRDESFLATAERGLLFSQVSHNCDLAREVMKTCQVIVRGDLAQPSDGKPTQASESTLAVKFYAGAPLCGFDERAFAAIILMDRVQRDLANNNFLLLKIIANRVAGDLIAYESGLNKSQFEGTSKPYSKAANRDFIDPSFIEEMRELNSPEDPHFFTNQCKLFKDNTSDLIGKLNKAIESQSMQNISAVAHSIKGVSSNFGAVAVAKLCDELENKSEQLGVRAVKSLGYMIDKELLDFYVHLELV